MTLQIKTYDGFLGFYIDGEPIFGSKDGDDPVSMLKYLGEHLEFKVEYLGEMTMNEVEKDFA